MALTLAVIIAGLTAIIAILVARSKHRNSQGPMNNN